jgi:hypothetical protein
VVLHFGLTQHCTGLHRQDWAAEARAEVIRLLER